MRRDLGECYDLAAKFPVLTPEQEAELGQRAADGDEEARWALVLGNLRIAAHYALRRAGRHGPVEDLFADAVIGMYKAACGFDPRKNRRFTTYATWRIRGEFGVSAPNYLRIRVPHHLLDNFANLSRGKHGEAARRAMATACTTDVLANDDRDITALYGADRDDATDEHAEREQQIARVRRWIGCLSPRLRAVIEARYGFDDRPRETLEEIGRRLGVCKERVRQMESEARLQLRHMARRDGLDTREVCA